MSDPTASTHSSNGSAHPSSSSALLTAEPPQISVNADLQRQLAGVDETQKPLIPESYTIDPDKPAPAPRTAQNRPDLQAGFVVIAVGGVIGFAVVFVVMFSGSSKKVEKAAVQPTPSPAVVQDESAGLKSKLAYQGQQQQINNQPTTPRPSSSPAARPATPRPASSSAAIAPTPASPRSSYTPPAPRYSPPASAPAAAQPASVSKPVDPFERWSQLATLGQSQGTVDESFLTALTQSRGLPIQTLNAPSVPESTVPGAIASARSAGITPSRTEPLLLASSDISTVQIGRSSPSSEGITDGARGILNRTPQSQLPRSRSQTVALGTATAAMVKMPMLWDMAGNNPPGMQRFTVSLSAPMLAEDGSVAFPTGTLFIAETHAVGAENNFVVASAIAVVYVDAAGQTKQEAIPVGTVLIRGQEGSALVARKLRDPGGAIAGQDLLVGVLSGLGNIGEILNQPESQTVTSGDRFSQTSTRSNPSVLAAALEGAFGTTADRLSERSDAIVEDMLSRPNVFVLAGETEVSVVVNSFFQVSR